MDTLRGIQDWYKSNCDENWEHDYGVEIDTLDNPGWSVAIDLLGTNLDGKIIEEVNCEVSANDWHVYKTENDQFIGYGDPTKLDYLLKVFIEWAKSQNEDWLQPPSAVWGIGRGNSGKEGRRILEYAFERSP